MRVLRIIVLLLLVGYQAALGQPVSSARQVGSPFISVFNAEDYQSSPQIWDMAQDSKGRLYFGNGIGVTRYDGATWKTFTVANSTTVRAIIITPDDKIYVGAKGTFGYFEEDSLGALKYTSLSTDLPGKYQNFRDVWQMAYFDGKVFFAPFEFLVSWDGTNLQVYDPPAEDGFKGIMQLPNALYVKHDNGVLQVQASSQALSPIAGQEELSKLVFANMYPYNQDSILISTSKKGLFWYTPQASPYLSPFPTEIDSFLHSTFIYKGLRLANGNYAFVSLSKGIIIMNPQGQEVDLLNKTHGLSDDATYAIYEDRLQNLWIGSNNGISYAELSSPVRHFQSGYKISGQVLSFADYHGKVYIGTTSGLFTWNPTTQDFDAVPKFNANFCWNIMVHQNQLFVGTNTGLYSLKGNDFYTIGEEERYFEVIAGKKHPNHIFTASLDGIHAFKYADGAWQRIGKVGNLKEVIRSVKLNSDEDELWAGSNFKGVYKCKLNWHDLSQSAIVAIDTTKGLPSLSNNYIYLLNNEIRIGSLGGLLKPVGDSLVTDTSFPIPEKYRASAIFPLVQDENNNIWVGLAQGKHDNNSNANRAIKLQYENASYQVLEHMMKRIPASVVDAFFHLNDQCWIGTSEGAFIYNEHSKPEGWLGQTIISRVHTKNGDISLIGNPTLPYEQNTVTFNFAAPLFEMGDKVMYSYWLEGNEDNWSEWTTEVKAHYTNLYEKDYVFHVKAKNIYDQEIQEARYYFSIEPPIYRSIWAYLGYLLLLALIVILIVKWNSRRLLKEKEVLEKEVQERTRQVTEQNGALLMQREEIATILEKLMESNELIEKKNKDITDSITYASRIQRAILPYKERLDKGLGEYFILFKPRDIVSGDYYWFKEIENYKILVVADCTGHGVPGAFMSMVGSALLDQIVAMKGIFSPEKILDEMHNGVKKALQQEQTINDDGMDASVCVIDEQKGELLFAGAKNNLIYIKDGELHEVKADRQSIGGKREKRSFFTKHTIPINGPMMVYLSSDGYQDQFGGPDGRKLMRKQFKEQLRKIHHLSMQEQQAALEQYLDQWMSGTSIIEQKQIDDILVVGIRLGNT